MSEKSRESHGVPSKHAAQDAMSLFRMSRSRRAPLKVTPQAAPPSFEISKLEEFWQRLRKDAAFFEEQAQKQQEATKKNCEDLEKERDDLKDRCCALDEKYNALQTAFVRAFQGV